MLSTDQRNASGGEAALSTTNRSADFAAADPRSPALRRINDSMRRFEVKGALLPSPLRDDGSMKNIPHRASPAFKSSCKGRTSASCTKHNSGNLHTRRQRCERTASPDRDKSTHELLPGERCFCDDRVRARDRAAESEGKSSPDKQPSAPSGHTASMHLFPQRSLTTAGKGPTANTRMRMCRRERIACRAV